MKQELRSVIAALCISFVIVMAITIVLVIMYMASNGFELDVPKYELLEGIPAEFKLDQKYVQSDTDTATIGFPRIYKPLYGNMSHNVRRINDATEHAEYFNKHKYNRVIAQEYHPGPLEYTIHIISDAYRNALYTTPTMRSLANGYHIYYIMQRELSDNTMHNAFDDVNLSMYGPVTNAVADSIQRITDAIPKFNDVRIDIRADTKANFDLGMFKIVEINDVHVDTTNYFKFNNIHVLKRIWLTLSQPKKNRFTLSKFRYYLTQMEGVFYRYLPMN